MRDQDRKHLLWITILQTIYQWSDTSRRLLLFTFEIQVELRQQEISWLDVTHIKTVFKMISPSYSVGRKHTLRKRESYVH